MPSSSMPRKCHCTHMVARQDELDDVSQRPDPLAARLSTHACHSCSSDAAPPTTQSAAGICAAVSAPVVATTTRCSRRSRRRARGDRRSRDAGKVAPSGGAVSQVGSTGRPSTRSACGRGGGERRQEVTCGGWLSAGGRWLASGVWRGRSLARTAWEGDRLRPASAPARQLRHFPLGPLIWRALGRDDALNVNDAL